MNKKVLSVVVSIIMVIFLTGISIADLLTNSDDTVKISKEAKITLAEEGIINPQTSELFCSNYKCKFKMWQDLEREDICMNKTTLENYNCTVYYDYKLGEHSIPERYCTKYSECDYEIEPECEVECLNYEDYTAEESFDLKHIKMVEVLEAYANWIKAVAEKPKPEVKLGAGNITLQEK